MEVADVEVRRVRRILVVADCLRIIASAVVGHDVDRRCAAALEPNPERDLLAKRVEVEAAVSSDFSGRFVIVVCPYRLVFTTSLWL